MRKMKGFTLIELLSVVLILGIIAVISSKMVSEGLFGYLTTKDVADADWQGRIAMERMARDIRVIGSSNNITTAAAAQLVFVDDTGTTITYAISGSTLTRNTQVLSDGIQSIAFTYFDLNGTTTAVLTNIRYIRIVLTVNQLNASYSLTTAIAPRNLY